MSEAALYICIECELAGRADEVATTTANKHGLCVRCGSSSVVPVDTLVALASEKKRSEAPPESTKDTRLRVQAMKDQRYRDSEPLRNWIKYALSHPTRIYPKASRDEMNQEAIAKALAEWDGWAWHVHYPWPVGDVEDNPVPGHFTIELIQGVKNGPRWFITLDASVSHVAEINEVRSLQDGTK